MSAECYVVYQMGKVGSSTVYASLRAAGLPAPLYKVHYLSDHGYERACRLYRRLPRQVPVPHQAATEELRHRLRSEPGLRWKVISLVREPVARDVSAYLQMVDVLQPALVSASASRLARAAGAQFLGFDEASSYTCRWFDDELRAAFGVDVYTQPFDHDRGWLRMSTERLDLMVLRLEDITSKGAAALSEFVGRPVPLRHDNSRSPAKLQAVYTEDIYREVVGRIRVPARICARVYASCYAVHFYRPEEITRYIARWSGGGEPAPAGDIAPGATSPSPGKAG